MIALPQPTSDVVGLAATALLAWTWLVVVGAASAVGGAVALVQRARRRAGAANVALAGLAVVASTGWGAIFLFAAGGSTRDAMIVGPVALMVVASASWFALALGARRATIAARGGAGR